jgi:hypothetical protein
MSSLKVDRDSIAITSIAAVAGLVGLVLVGSFAIWTAGHLKAPEIAAPLSHSVPPG